MSKIEYRNYAGSHENVFTEEDLDRGALLPGGVQINADAFGNEGFATLQLQSFNQGDTTITLDTAAPEDIPEDMVLRVGDGEFLMLTSRVAEGDTSISVEAAGFGTSQVRSAAYTGTDASRIYIPPGKLIGRTASEASSGTGFGPVNSEHSVAAVDTTNDTFTVAGDVASYALKYGVITLAGSTGNDGTYNVVSASYDSTADETTISVAEDVADGTADGTLHLVADDQVYLTIFEVLNARDNPTANVLRHGSHVYENVLPDWGDYTDAEKAAIRYHYEAVPME